MKLFLDSADTTEIQELVATGLIDGVTTNPTLVARSGGDLFDTLATICRLTPGPVSAEVTATNLPGMLAEGEKLAKIAPNIVVKLPLTVDGLITCRKLRVSGTRVNVTLCFQAGQALLAAKAGATFISPFIGRLDDHGGDGMGLIRDIAEIYRRFPEFKTEILAASVRETKHVVESAKAGAQCATLPPGVFRSLFTHDLTDKGLAAFLADWRASGQSILGSQLPANGRE